MKIEFSQEKTEMTLDELKLGDGFIYEHTYHIKTAYYDKAAGEDGLCPHNCMMYYGGWHSEFLPWDTKVEPIETKLIIYQNKSINKSKMEVKCDGN